VNIREGVLICAYFLPKNSTTPLYLIVKQRHGLWSIPSGGKETGETYKEAAIRELEEETGIKEAILIKTDITNEFNYDMKTKGKQEVYYTKVTSMELPGTTMEDEIKDIKWISPTEMKQYLIRPGQYKKFQEIEKVILISLNIEASF